MHHIIVIDDEDMICTLLRNYLEDRGYRVSVAHDGRQALDLFEQRQADLIITDIFMPEKDGLEVISALRKKRPEIPIIAMSGGNPTNKQDVLHIAKSLGAARIMDKPIELRELLATIHALLPPVSPPVQS